MTMVLTRPLSSSRRAVVGVWGAVERKTGLRGVMGRDQPDRAR